MVLLVLLILAGGLALTGFFPGDGELPHWGAAITGLILTAALCLANPLFWEPNTFTPSGYVPNDSGPGE